MDQYCAALGYIWGDMAVVGKCECDNLSSASGGILAVM